MANVSRRCSPTRFARITSLVAAIACLPLCVADVVEAAEESSAPRRPNVLLVMTDDQGFADFGFQGNPAVSTPVLDKLASESVWLTNFHVSPVCTPTRASLMTGRYNYRTRAIDTYIGRAMMDPAETTIAEMLRQAGYKTGHFGKWHLGDCYPLRAMDQGFDESVAHRGGGLRQPADAPDNPGYTDAILYRNGKPFKSSGYCTDVFVDEATEFITRNKQHPFFVYLALNAPHGPFEVPDADLAEYKDVDVSVERFPAQGNRIEGKYDVDTVKRVYAMISNFDRGFGRLLKRLGELGVADNTLVVFLTDNGAAIPSYNAGLRGRKGTVYDGGIRTACLMRWPALFKSPTKNAVFSAHLDITPTILAATGAVAPAGVAMDGQNLLPWLTGKRTDQPERTLHFQWHRADVPGEDRAYAVKTTRWKLVQTDGVAENAKGPFKAPQLFDIPNDPFEQVDLASRHPEIVMDLLGRHHDWFVEVSSTRGYGAPRIELGTPHETTTELTRQDWRGPTAGWTPKSVGEWQVRSKEAHRSKVVVRFTPGQTGQVSLTAGESSATATIENSDGVAILPEFAVPAGEFSVRATLKTTGGVIGANYVDFTRQDGQ